VNNVQGLGGGIVAPNNVRHFLADENNVNDFIINDFFSYLTGSTTTIEFAEIYNSDQKLSDVFNSYYESAIVNSVAPPISVIDESLIGTTGITVVENQYFELDGVAPTKGLDYIPLDINDSTRKLRAYSALTTFTTDESYYVPVFILRNAKQMAGLTYQTCDEIVSLVLNAPDSNQTGIFTDIILSPDFQLPDFGGDGDEDPGGSTPPPPDTGDVGETEGTVTLPGGGTEGGGTEGGGTEGGGTEGGDTEGGDTEGGGTEGGGTEGGGTEGGGNTPTGGNTTIRIPVDGGKTKLKSGGFTITSSSK
jgi:hypothetical protein